MNRRERGSLRNSYQFFEVHSFALMIVVWLLKKRLIQASIRVSVRLFGFVECGLVRRYRGRRSNS